MLKSQSRMSVGIINLTVWSAMLIFCVGFSVVAGCGGDSGTESGGDNGAESSGAETSSDDRNAAGQNRGDKVASSNIGPDATSAFQKSTSEKLIGEWHGAAWFDEAALAAKLEPLSEAERTELLAQAKFFGATMMAFVFEADGTMENVVDVLPEGGNAGPPLAGAGTWKVVREQVDGFVIETVEQAEDGTLTPSQRVYKFYEGNDNFAMHVPLQGPLGECNPLIIFERQVYVDNSEGIETYSEEDVAEAQSSETVR